MKTNSYIKVKSNVALCDEKYAQIFPHRKEIPFTILEAIFFWHEAVPFLQKE